MWEFKFNTFSDFITMSGHGTYVWACVGFMLVFFTFLIVSPLLQRKATLKNIQKQQRLKEQQVARHSAEQEAAL